MDVRILGPLEIVGDDGQPLALGGRKQRALLARLILDANRTVSIEQLVDDLWGEDVPGSAVKMVHIHVSALRKALPEHTIVTRPSGYSFETDPATIDVVRFDGLRQAATDALRAGDAEQAAQRLRDALELWRGAPLHEFPEPFAAPEANHLEERRRQALEERVDADLALGRHRDLIGELERLTARHPLRERLRAQLMLALYRSGRQADALATYRDFRRALQEQIGLEPSSAIRALEGQILRQDAALEPSAAVARDAQARRGLEPIRYVESVGGYSIAYQVLGDGPLDIVFVHGWVCTFQAAWEWPALASFYDRLAQLGRLILFDKRGTGLSDRVYGIASLEERMDDMRAVMDAVGSQRAALLGVSEGGPMSILFAATHPERTAALVTMGSYARRSWAEDYPVGARPEHEGWLRPTPQQWGREAAERFLAQRAPSIARDEEAIRWYASYLVRGASPSAVAQITDMNEDIDVRQVLPSVRVPALVLHRAEEYMRDASRYLGARLPRAHVAELPGADHLPWEGAQADVLDEIQRFLGGLQVEPEPEVILTTILDLEGVEDGGVALARFRGKRHDERRSSFDGPARAVRCALALRETHPELRAGVHTGECERHDGRLSGAALEIAAGVAAEAAPGEILVTSTVHDLVALSGVELEPYGTRALPLAGASREWRLFRAL